MTSAESAGREATTPGSEAPAEPDVGVGPVGTVVEVQERLRSEVEVRWVLSLVALAVDLTK
jgi:hypothetical protein